MSHSYTIRRMAANIRAFLCGRHGDVPVRATHRVEDGERRRFLCEACARELARALGMKCP